MNGHFHSNSVLRLTPPEVPKKGTFLSFNFGRRQLYNDNENFYKCSVGIEKWMLFSRLFSLLLNWAVKDSSENKRYFTSMYLVVIFHTLLPDTSADNRGAGQAALLCCSDSGACSEEKVASV